MKVSRQPFQLGVFMAQYAHYTCLLCHSRPRIVMCQQNHQHNSHSSIFSISKLNKGILCQACHESIYWLPEPFNIKLSEKNVKKSIQQVQQKHIVIQHATYYQHPINQLILKFKSGDMSPLPILVHIIRQLPKPDDCHSNNSVIVPVPTTQARLVSRGFNPMSILSAYLSHHWQIPIWHGVKRVDSTLSQKSLNRQQRIINVQGAFNVTEIDLKTITNKRLLLFDDVTTTGSTLRELAITLANTLDDNIISLPNLLPLSGYCLAHGNKL